jgi:hypothetical protein
MNFPIRQENPSLPTDSITVDVVVALDVSGKTLLGQLLTTSGLLPPSLLLAAARNNSFSGHVRAATLVVLPTV